MDIKRKTCDIRTWENIYFSTYPPTTLIHLSHRFTSASKLAAQKSFDCSLTHFRAPISTSFVISEMSATINASQHKQETFLYEYHLHSVKFAHKKAHNRTLLFGSTLLKQVAILATEIGL
jgi:hypothetical protein